MVKETMLDKNLWTILQYFLVQESDFLDKSANYQSNKQNPKSNENWRMPVQNKTDHFITYPTEIWSDLKGQLKITKPSVSSALTKLKSLKILHSEIGRTKKFQKTPHYHLNPDVAAIKKIVRLMRVNCTPEKQVQLLDLSFFQRQLNPSLVKGILSEKEVSILKPIDLIEWDPNEAQQIFEWYRKKRSLINPMDKTVKLFIDPLLDRYIHSRLQEFSQPNLTQCDMFFLPVCGLNLPVLPEGISDEEKSLKIQNLNPQVFQEFPPLHSFQSAIKCHYKYFEYNRLILPILSLIQVSPAALDEFINGNWGTFCQRFSDDVFGPLDCAVILNPFGNSYEDNFLFRLLFIAIQDVTQTIQIPRNGMIEDVYFRMTYPGQVEAMSPSLFTIKLKDHKDINFDSCFSTRRSFSRPDAENTQEIYRNVTVDIKNRNPLSKKFKFFDHSDIIDPKKMLSELAAPSSSIISKVRDRMSNRIRTILIGFYPEIIVPPSLKEILVEELNQLIVSNSFYDEIISHNDQVSTEIKNEIEILRLYESGKFELSWTPEQKHEHILRINRNFLESLFPILLKKYSV